MSYIGQAPGLGQRTAFRFVAVAGQTTFSGPDAQGYPMGYTPRLVDVYLNGRLLSEPDYTAADGSTIILGQGLTAGDELRVLAQAPFSPANTYTMSQADSFQRRRNRITDPGMRVSQEQGNNLLTLGNLYPSDSIQAFRQGATGSAQAQRIALATPGGSPFRVRFTVTGANASPAAGEQAWLSTRIEGLDIADLRFGTASARNIAVRFGCRASVAGTYPVALLNAALNRSYIGLVTISPSEVGQDVVTTVSLTGDQTGSWSTDNTPGIIMYVTFNAGPNLIGAPGWQNGAALSTPACTNLMATNGATFDLFDVGLYDVTGLQQGVIPPFELASYADDLLKCQRYYEQVAAGVVATTGGVGGYYSNRVYYKAVKRVSPSVSLLTPISSNNVAGNIYVEGVANYQEGFNATIQANATNSVCSGFGLFVANARL